MSNNQALFLVLILLKTSINVESIFEDFFKNSADTVNSFLYNQISHVTKLKDTVSNYIEEQNNKIDLLAVVALQRENFTGNVRNTSTYESYFIPTDDPDSRPDIPDSELSVTSVVTRNFYSIETHVVISQGYILSLHRIPRPRTTQQISNKSVILQHGLFTSSADWIRNGANKSLAYVLADAGYDVWMPNIRGNKYSNEHAWYKRDSKQYWNFSWHEVAQFDMPAIIDYILTIKGETKIAYIGHSMGNTIMFTMLSLRPEYNQKLSVGLALAPAVFLSNMESPLKSIARVTSYIAQVGMLSNSYEFAPKNSFYESLTNICNPGTMDCNNIVSSLSGNTEERINSTRFNPLASNVGSGTSWKTVVHLTQMILSGKFQQFDYGSDSNLRMYGSDSAPAYNLSKVTLDVTLFWAQNDLLANEKDVRKLRDHLPNTTQMYLVPNPKFNHVDYLRARDAPQMVNRKVLEILGDTSSSSSSKQP